MLVNQFYSIFSLSWQIASINLATWTLRLGNLGNKIHFNNTKTYLEENKDTSLLSASNLFQELGS